MGVLQKRFSTLGLVNVNVAFICASEILTRKNDKRTNKSDFLMIVLIPLIFCNSFNLKLFSRPFITGREYFNTDY